MNANILKLKQQNAIAYNRKLRSQLRNLHEMLGDEITDLVTGELGDPDTFFTEAQKVIKTLSELTANLSVLLLKVKESKKELSAEEERDYHMIEELTDALGNLQYEIHMLIKHMQQSQKIKTFTAESLRVIDKIVETQEKFRAVRAQINNFGYMSKNPEIAALFSDKEAS